MNDPTYTVKRSFAAMFGGFKVELNRLPGLYEADEELPEGAAVRIVDGKAVKS